MVFEATVQDDNNGNKFDACAVVSNGCCKVSTKWGLAAVMVGIQGTSAALCHCRQQFACDKTSLFAQDKIMFQFTPQFSATRIN